MTSPILDLDAPNIKSLVYTKTNIGGWFFDAFLKTTHTSKLTITEHPVQTGGSLNDHAFMQPRELVMEIGMSDVAMSLVPGQFSQRYSRSVTAFEVLQQLQQLRVPIQVHTRLGIYQNMLIETLSAPDDGASYHRLKCTVTLREVLVAQVKTVKVSARPLVTDMAQTGSPEPITLNQSMLKQMGVDKLLNGFGG